MQRRIRDLATEQLSHGIVRLDPKGLERLVVRPCHHIPSKGRMANPLREIMAFYYALHKERQLGTKAKHLGPQETTVFSQR